MVYGYNDEDWGQDGYYKRNNNVGYTVTPAPKKEYTVEVTALEPTECFKKLQDLFWRQPKWEALHFTSEAWFKLNCFTHLAGSFEITGYGKVEKIDGHDTITDIRILQQIVEKAEVNVTDDAGMMFMMSIPEEELGLWVLDWHSHVNMSTFASTTDTKNYNEMYKMKNASFPALIFNKKQEVWCHEWYGDDVKGDSIKVTYDGEQKLSMEEYEAMYKECYELVQSLCAKSITYEVVKSKTTPSTSVTRGTSETAKQNAILYKGWTADDWKTAQYNKELGYYIRAGIPLSKQQRKKIAKAQASMDKRIAEMDTLRQKYGEVELTDDEVEALWQDAVEIDYSEDERDMLYCGICHEPLTEDEEVEHGFCINCLTR